MSNLEIGKDYQIMYEVRQTDTAKLSKIQTMVIPESIFSKGFMAPQMDTMLDSLQIGDSVTVNFKATESDMVIFISGNARMAMPYHYNIDNFNLRKGFETIVNCDKSNLQYADGDGRYRYGFNGQEQDNEIYGDGGSYTAEFWQYDPRLGRRWNVDPVVKPWRSSYDAFSNSPIVMVDPKGDDDYYSYQGKFLGSDGSKTDNIRIITSSLFSNITGQDQRIHETPDVYQKRIASQLTNSGNSNIVRVENSSNKYQQLWKNSNAGSGNPVENIGYIVLDVKDFTLSFEIIEVTNATATSVDDPYVAGGAFNGDPSKIVLANVHTHPTDNKNVGKLGKNYKNEELVISDESNFENQYGPVGDGQTAKSKGARYTIGNQNVDYNSPNGRKSSRNNLTNRKSLENGTKDIKRHALRQYGEKKK